MKLDVECPGGGGDGSTYATCASRAAVTLRITASEVTEVELRTSVFQFGPSRSRGTTKIDTPTADGDPTTQDELRWTGEFKLRAPRLWLPLRLTIVASGKAQPALWLVPRPSIVVSTVLVIVALALMMLVVSPSLATLQVTLTEVVKGISGAAIVALAWKVASSSGETLLGKHLPWVGIPLLWPRALLAAALILVVPCTMHGLLVTRIYNSTKADIQISRPGGIARIAPGAFMTVAAEDPSSLITAIYGNERYCVPSDSKQVCQEPIYPYRPSGLLTRVLDSLPDCVSTRIMPEVIQVRCAEQQWGDLKIERTLWPDLRIKRTLGADCVPVAGESRMLGATQGSEFTNNKKPPIQYDVVYPWSPEDYVSVRAGSTGDDTLFIAPLDVSSVPLFKHTAISSDQYTNARVPARPGDIELFVEIRRGQSVVSTLKCHHESSLASGLTLRKVTASSEVSALELRGDRWRSTWLAANDSTDAPWVCMPNSIDRTTKLAIEVTVGEDATDITLPFSASSSIEIHDHGKVVCGEGWGIHLRRHALNPGFSGKDPVVGITFDKTEIWTANDHQQEHAWLCNFHGEKGDTTHASGAPRDFVLESETPGNETLRILPRVCYVVKGKPESEKKVKKVDRKKQKKHNLNSFVEHGHCDEIWD